jgi:hypothetical protein
VQQQKGMMEMLSDAITLIRSSSQLNTDAFKRVNALMEVFAAGIKTIL